MSLRVSASVICYRTRTNSKSLNSHRRLSASCWPGKRPHPWQRPPSSDCLKLKGSLILMQRALEVYPLMVEVPSLLLLPTPSYGRERAETSAKTRERNPLSWFRRVGGSEGSGSVRHEAG